MLQNQFFSAKVGAQVRCSGLKSKMDDGYDNNDVQEVGGHNVPRRLEESDEIIGYLQRLDEQLTSKGVNVQDQETMETLVENVLDEIKTRVASVASDRKTSVIVEKLVLYGNVQQLIEFVRRFIPYSLFLAQNRYSSHVLQVHNSLLLSFY